MWQESWADHKSHVPYDMQMMSLPFQILKSLITIVSVFKETRGICIGLR